MKIVIDNVEFPYDIGCKILKLRGGDSPFEELNDIWKDIVTPDFSEIGLLQNMEQRRIGLKYYGLEKLLNEVDPNLVDKQTIEKETTWVSEGKVVNGYPAWMFNSDKKHRSKTFPGIAQAMASQWGNYLKEKYL